MVIKRKSIMFDSLVTINATSLFFHNRRFETPTTKKDITNDIKVWMQRLQAPPPPPASKTSKATLTASTASESKASLTLVNSTTTTTQPTSCAVVFASTTDILQRNQARGTKRRVEELEHDRDSDNITSALYGGLDEDEDDEIEAADAALSPLKPAVAAQMSKVSPLPASNSQQHGYLLALNTSAECRYTARDHIFHTRAEVWKETRQSSTPRSCTRAWEVDVDIHPNFSSICRWCK
jgi:hypothetical protein